MKPGRGRRRGLVGAVTAIALACTAFGGAASAAPIDSNLPDPESTAPAPPVQLTETDAGNGNTEKAAEFPIDREDIGPGPMVALPEKSGSTDEEVVGVADPLPLLTLTKSVSPTTALNPGLAPGQNFTYTIFVGCNQAVAGCIDAEITDVMPKELAGMKVVAVTAISSGSATKPTYEWSPALGAGQVIEEGSRLVVTPSQPLPNNETGIQVGEGVTVTVTVAVPNDWPPTWPHNGKPITNEAKATATNSKPADDSVQVLVTVDRIVNVGATKTWQPAEAAILAGTASTLKIGVSNASNIPVDTLVIQEPKAAPDSANKLDSSNPFTITDFTGFGSSSLPPGATSVKTEVYVQVGGKYVWKEAATGTAPALGTTATADVAGIRLTYTGKNIAVGAGSTIPLNLVQRATNRNTGSAVASTTVNNVAQGTAVKAGVGQKSTDARANHSISPANLGANITKDIQPGRIPAGTSATATLVGKNNTPTGANTLTISDQGFFIKDTISFGGFTDSTGGPGAPSKPSVSPSGAVLTGEILYKSFTGATETVKIPTSGNLGPPSFGYANVAGFDVVWTAPHGAEITSRTASTVRFKIIASEDAAKDQNPRPAETNTATVKLTTPYGDVSDQDSDKLTVFHPEMDVKIDKSLRPETPVSPGDQVLAELKPSYATTSTNITPTSLVVEDTLDQSKGQPNGGFWNGFDLYSIAPTGVPASTGLTVAVQLPSGKWHTVITHKASGSSASVSLAHDELVAALPAGTSTANLTGVRFTFVNPNGVSAGLIPNTLFQAREEMRNGWGKTYTKDGKVTKYLNTATVVGTATDSNGKTYTGDDRDDAPAAIKGGAGAEGGSGSGVGTGAAPDFGVEKQWKLTETGNTPEEALPALSGQNSWTALYWRVSEADPKATPAQSPARKVVLQDDSDITGSSTATVYETFNLVGLPGIKDSSSQGSNGWALRWDKVTNIEIFFGDAWVQPKNAKTRLSRGNYIDVTTDAAGVPTKASFAGFSLTADEQAGTTALRITIEPNLETRTAAMVAGTRGVPGINAGVTATQNMREFRTKWLLRDTLRTNSSIFVTPDRVYNPKGINKDQQGIVNNTVRMTVNDAAFKEADDAVRIVKRAPSVTVEKTASNPSVTDPGDEVTFTSIARSLGAAAPTYLRLADPMPCTDTSECGFANTQTGISSDPYAEEPPGGWLNPAGGAASPFERFDITKVTAQAQWSGADLSASTAWVLHYAPAQSSGESGRAYVSESMSVKALNSLTEDQLADVVGVTVTYNAAPDAVEAARLIPQNKDFTLELQTRLRGTARSTGKPTELQPNKTESVTNTAFAQVWDPVLSTPEDKTAITDTSHVAVEQRGKTIKVAPGKTISPEKILEVDRHVPVTVVLSATDDGSELAPKQVWVQDEIDSSARFWDVFELKGLAGSLKAPADANQVSFKVLVPRDRAPGGHARERSDAEGEGAGEGEGAPGAREHGDLEWIAGEATAIADATLPDVDLQTVQGIRATFSKAGSRAGGEYLNDTKWETEVPLTFAIRDSYVFRASGEETVTNKMEAQSVRDPENQDAAANSIRVEENAEITLSSGFFALSVNKLANGGDRAVEIGTPYPWTLSFTNTGTGALTITGLTDYLGDSDEDGNRIPGTSHLAAAAAPQPEYQTSAGGTLATEGLTYQYRPETDEITWTWPAGGRQMMPGETFTITVYMTLEPGVESGQKAFNSMTVHTQQALNGGNDDAGGVIPAFINTDLVMEANENNGSWGADPSATPQGAGTKDYVQPKGTLNLWTQKAVYGYEGTAHTKVSEINPETQECAPSVHGPNGQNYFPSPCLSDTRYSTSENVVDKWLLRTNNTTTTAVTELVIFDDLPVSGDEFLIGDAPRGSDYRAVLKAEPTIHLPSKTRAKQTTVEVTTSKNACEGTWEYLTAKGTPGGSAPCEERSATWTKATGNTDWSKVAGLRIRIQFDQATPLGNGQTVDVTYETYNVVESATETKLSGEVPIPHQESWNQFGIQWQFDNPAKEWSQRIPAEVGVTPLGGPLQVKKNLDGPAKRYAPATIDFSVDCSIDQPGAATPVKLDLGELSTLTLTRFDDGYDTKRIDGIPLGAKCTVKEIGETGATSSTGTPTTVEIKKQATDEVPTAQSANVTNTYEWAKLSVTKRVTSAVDVDFGDFTFNLACTTKDGQTVKFDNGGTEEDSTSFTLAKDETWNSPAETIPHGSTCVLTETDPARADKLVITGDNVTPNEDGSANIVVDKDTQVAFTATNTFNSGTLKVEKIVESLEGGLLPLDGQLFEFNAKCVFTNAAGKKQPMLDETFTLEGGNSKTFGPYPRWTECQIDETKNGGAARVTMDPEDGKVVIDGDEEEIKEVTVTARNAFPVGSIPVVKEILGVGTNLYGVGPFEVTATCKHNIDGEIHTLTLPGEGKLELTAENNFQNALETVPVDAVCTFEETATGGAHASAVAPDSVTITGDESQVSLTVTNDFHAGRIAFTKEVAGEGAELYGNGTFQFDYDCTLPESTLTAPNAPDSSGRFHLQAGQTWESELFPSGTACVITEVATGGATRTSVPEEGVELVIPYPGESGDEGEDAEEVGGTEQPTVEAFTAINYFEIGSIEVLKKIDGASASTHRDDIFEAQILCTYDVDGVKTKVPLANDGKVSLSRVGGWKALIEGIPAGASCQVTETDDGGAQLVTMDPADGKLVIEAKGTTQVTITNQFGQLAKTGVGGLYIVRWAGAAMLILGAAAYGLGFRRSQPMQCG